MFSNCSIYGFLLFFCSVLSLHAHTLSGNVLGGTNPLEGAEVTLIDGPSGVEIERVITNAAGTYSFSVIDGTYNLSVSPPASSGFGDHVVSGIVVHGSDVTHHVVLIANAANYSGVVRTPWGDPVSGVRLTLVDAVTNDEVGEDLFTDESGSFSFPLATGTYYMHARGYGFQSNIYLAGYWSINRLVPQFTLSGGLTQDIIMPITRTRGQVVDERGDPVAGVTLINRDSHYNAETYQSLYQDWSYSANHRVITDDNGAFEFISVANPDTEISLNPPAGSDLAITTFNQDFSQDRDGVEWVIADPLIWSGVLRFPDGTPVEKIELEIYKLPQGQKVTDDQFTDVNGNFRFALTPGEYRVVATCNAYRTTQFVPNYFYINPLFQVTLNEDRYDDVILPVSLVTGHVRDEFGDPLVGAKVQVYEWWSVPSEVSGYIYYTISNRNYSPYIVTDENGYYEMMVLAYDSYRTVVDPTEAYPDLGMTVFSELDWREDSVADFVIPQGVTWRGNLLDPKGEQIDTFYIQASIGDTYNYDVGVHPIQRGGQFEFRLAPGDYHFTFRGYRSNAVANVPGYWIASRHLDKSLSVDLDEDVVIPFKYIRGYTTDGNGVPVPGVTLDSDDYVYPASGNTYYTADNHDHSPLIVSEENGFYEHPTFAIPDLTLVVIPPSGSGFANTAISPIDVTEDVGLDVILGFQDVNPPLILAGPYINNITDTSAVVEWQTNEPASSQVTYGTSNPPGNETSRPGYRADHSVNLTGLQPDTIYYVVVSSSDPAGNGPVESDVVSFRTAPEPDTTPPLILSGPEVDGITENSAVIRWTTSEPADGLVRYDRDSSLGNLVEDQSLVSGHEFTLTGLAANTRYFFQVASSDARGNGPTTSAVLDFHTLRAPDTTAPLIIAGPMVIDITDTAATVVWETNEAATSGVSYNDGTAYGVHSDDSLTTLHQVRLTGLTPDTLYNYTVSSSDGSGNGPTLSDEDSFRTLPAPDTEPPLILEGPIVLGITHQSAVIRWKTNEPADSVIQYGTDPAELDLSASRAALVQNHNLPLVGLADDTVWYFRVCATDARGNGPACSDVFSFKTKDKRDNQAPIFTEEPRVLDSTDRSVTLYWETDEPADTTVLYGSGGELNLRRANATKSTRHQIVLAGLEPGTAYAFEARSADLWGNVASFSGSSKRAAGFDTDASPDNTAPVFTGAPRVVSLGSDSAIIAWETDELADSRMHWGLAGDTPGFFTGQIEYTDAHLVFLTGLSPSTSYSVVAGSKDIAGNGPTTAAELVFATPASGGTAAPSLSVAPTPVTIDETQATIAWETDAYATTQIDFGLAEDALHLRVATTGLELQHQLVLTNLEMGTTYFYRSVSSDSLGREVVSEVASFQTAGTLPQFEVADVALTEGDNGTSNAVFTVTLSRASSYTASVDYATVEDTATAGVDFEHVAGTLVFAPGDTSKTVSVTIYNDTEEEEDESFSLVLSNNVSSQIADSEAVAVITDNDQVCVSILASPADLAICSGSDVSFTVAASGSSLASNPTQFQWFKDGVVLAGETSATLHIGSAGSADAGSYHCEVSNNCNSLATESAELSVDESLANPGAISGGDAFCAGETVTFSIDALSGADRYDWSLPAGTSVVEDLGNSITVTLGDEAGSIGVTATNLCGTTSAASLSISISTPVSALAGEDVSMLQDASVTLAANLPEAGSGAWSITSGPDLDLAQFDDATDPGAVFTPAGGVGDYVLSWAVTHAPCEAQSDDVTISVLATADVSLVLQLDEAAPNVGDTVVLTATVANAGPSSATGLAISFDLPASLSVVTSSGSGSFADGIWQPADLAAAGSASLDLNLRVDGGAAAVIGALVSALNEADPDSLAGNNDPAEDDQAEVSLIPKRADLALSGTVDQPLPSVGELVSLDLVLSNHGPDHATEVRLQLSAGEGLSIISGDAAGFDPQSGLWSLDQLASGESAQLSVSLQVVASSLLHLNAEVWACQVFDPDSTPANGVAEGDDDAVSFTLDPRPYLVFPDALHDWLAANPLVDTFDDDEISPAEAAAVTVLDLGGTGITDYTGIEAFSNLQVLGIGENGLFHLPDLRGLSSLRQLRAERNYLSGLGSESGDFALPVQLQLLYLGFNQLRQLPAELLSLTALTDLNLRYNQLFQLPDGFEALGALRVLNLPGNRLQALPDGLGLLAGLEIVVVDDNRLRELPDLSGAVALQIFSAAYNLITTAPDLSAQGNLSFLDLRHNRLTEIAGIAVNPSLGYRSGDGLNLIGNYLGKDVCPDLVTLIDRFTASGAGLAFAEQGNIHSASDEFPVWGDPLEANPLLDWIFNIDNGVYNYDLNCR